ncbi:L-lactate permease [Saccharopolyspora karakumensis]
MTVTTGHFGVLQRSFTRVSGDRRIQAVITAFCFGALLEALAGFGTPVAITTVMLLALGFSPITSAVVALVANTAPVAFGAPASPLVTLASVTDLLLEDLGAMTGRQTPLLAVFVPIVLVGVLDGRKGVRQTLPATLTCGITFGLAQFVSANYISVPLADIVASLVAAGATVLLLKVWTPRGGLEAEPSTEVDSRGEVVRAYLPYLIIIAVFVVAQISVVHDLLDAVTVKFDWPGLHITDAGGDELSLAESKFNWLTSAGSLLLIAGLLSIPAIGAPGRAAERYLATYAQLKWPIVTVMSVLAIAYAMNASGQTATLGTWMAGAGGVFALISPVLGWLGTAVTGSGTSSNSLFGALQVSAANQVGRHGSRAGRRLERLRRAPGQDDLAAEPRHRRGRGRHGREGDIFRRVLPWSLIFLVLMCALAYLQSLPVLGWMVPQGSS